MSIISRFRATATGFAGNAIDDWAIQRASRQWGIYSTPTVQNAYDKRAQAAVQKLKNATPSGTSSRLDHSIKRVLSAAHVESVSFQRDADITEAPQEDGAFTSYNKAMRPYRSTITMLCDGTESGNIGSNLLPSWLKSIAGNGPDSVKRDFIATLDYLVEDTNLYFVATPERIYKRANITGYRFRREAKAGVTLIAVDIDLEEVRSAQTRQYGTAKQQPWQTQTRDTGYTAAMPATQDIENAATRSIVRT